MTLGSHLGPLARSYIENADVVFVAVSDAIVELWIKQMNRDVRSLQPYYREGKSRADTYDQMVEAMLVEVRRQERVRRFYGHPGVFALPPHEAIRIAARGLSGPMEPGISAEDCLYADLGIDPGTFGCQHFEASQLLFFKRRIDPTAYLVLWQVGVVGDQSLTRFSTGAAYRRLLVDVLARDYPLDHEVIVYRAATLPIQQPRMDRVALGELSGTSVELPDTLVIPPARALEIDEGMLKRLAALERKAKRE
jgi:hypothetical protein